MTDLKGENNEKIGHYGQTLTSASKKTRVCKKKTSSLRLAKRQKAQFTDVNEHFCRKRNEKIGVFLQTLTIKTVQKN